MFLQLYESELMIFFTWVHITIFYLTFSIIGSQVISISILGLLNRSLILSTKWVEFITYDEDLIVSGLMSFTRKRLMLNLGCWQWVLLEYYPYVF